MNSIVELTAEERVDNGWRWLDETSPGWERQIDPPTISLRSGENCICGQVFGDVARVIGVHDSSDRAGNGYRFSFMTLFPEVGGWITEIVGSKPADPMVLEDDGYLVGSTLDHQARAYLVATALGFCTDQLPADEVTNDELEDEWRARWDNSPLS